MWEGILNKKSEFHGTTVWLEPDRGTCINMLKWIDDNQVVLPCVPKNNSHLKCIIYSHGHELEVVKGPLLGAITIKPSELRYVNQGNMFMIKLENDRVKGYINAFYNRIPNFNIKTIARFDPQIVLS